MKLSKIALMMATLAASSAAWSHGYIEVPESRAYKCKLGSNTDCGRAQWEPQSVEQVSGFPGGATPLDGQLASGGVNGFESLDRQGVNVWALNTMKPGPQTFTWYHTAKHKTNKLALLHHQTGLGCEQAAVARGLRKRAVLRD